MHQGNALLRLCLNIAKVAGPSIGGALVVASGPGWGLALDADTFFVAAILLSRMRIQTAPRGQDSLAKSMAEGWTEFWSRPWLWAIVLQFALVNVAWVGAFQVVGPALHSQRPGGAAAWGFVLSGMALGLILGGAVVLWWQRRDRDQDLSVGESIVPAMTSTTQAYAYAAPSSLVDGRLGLATSGGRALSGPVLAPRFFSGVVTQAAPAAAALLGIADVALARYHRPQSRPGWMRDPVVTCNGDRLRFESFSACGGVYARLDLLGGALDGEVFDRGTTNVDVNPPLREALARIGPRDPLHLGVGLDELVVTTGDGAVVEKKVPLPERWLRGFAEVQVIASRMDLRGELTGMAAVRFLRGLPKRGTVWVAQAGRELKVHDREVPGSVRLSGPNRLGTLLPLLRFAKALRVYGGADATSSAWELELPGMRYTLTLSPERWRGFSGEGATLDDLATAEAEDDADVVGMLLNFEPEVEIGLLAERAGIPADRVRAALTRLGAAGRVGYDLSEAAHFHRELPYDKEHVMLLNPRLAKARALAEAGAVRLDGEFATVTTAGGRRRVSLADGSCTCEWWWDHRGSRGPCKHVLAARIVARVAVEVAP